MIYLFSVLLLLVVFFFGFLWGIHDCKKAYSIPKGFTPDQIVVMPMSALDDDFVEDGD